MAKGKVTKKSTKVSAVKKNPLFESRPKNFRIGGDVQPKRDLTRFVKWPKYVLVQRQKRVLLGRLKVPPQVHQFAKTLDKNQSAGLLKLFAKYAPETVQEKKARLLKAAENKVEKAALNPADKPLNVKFGLNHITTLVENKQAKLVVIAHDVDPIELVLWLPQLCRKQNVPYVIVKSKSRLGKLVHMKNATALALTEVRKEDQAELELYCKNALAQFNNNLEVRKTWGGGSIGIKSQHKQEAIRKALEKEALKKAGV